MQPELPSAQCISCAYPLDRDRDVLSVLARVKSMMAHVGFTVDRVLVEDARSGSRMSVTLELRPASPKKRTRSPEHSSDPPPKRPAQHCKLCASSCCSTNSLCKANACSHHAEEESRPAPPSPNHAHHRHHKHVHRNHPHMHHTAPPSSRPAQPAVVPDPAIRPRPERDPRPPAYAPRRPPRSDREDDDVPEGVAAVVRQPPPQQEEREVVADAAAAAASGWTATTAPAGAAAFDAGRVQPLGAVVDFAVAPRVRPPVPARTSPVSRLSEGNKEELRPPPELVCRPCATNFETELELRKHQFAEHKDDKIVTRTSEGRFLCLMHSCPQSFVRRHVMERHFKTVHMMVREFPCESCDKSFADSSTREAHRSAVHEKRKPWVCDQCSSCFTQSSSLGKHRRRFHQETVVSNPQKN